MCQQITVYEKLKKSLLSQFDFELILYAADVVSRLERVEGCLVLDLKEQKIKKIKEKKKKNSTSWHWYSLVHSRSQ